MTWQTRLIHWYRKNRRDLPWRRTKDPYKIWVSEIMLQQTTVETVIQYYHRFLKRFPNLQRLAEADQEEVLRYWAGLGYYSRARNLHRAAQILKAPSGRTTRFPETADNWQQLPGIGRYTAGAIASIAFDEKAPILDGNVIRVLSRLFSFKQDPASPEGKKLFWKKAEEILPQKNCGDFNQALMELGATVCHPTSPDCPLCPLKRECRALRQGNPESYPRIQKRTVYRQVQITAAVVEREGRFLLRRRPEKGLLKGMWEFPMVEGTLMKLRRQLPFKPRRELPLVRHSILNQRLSVIPYLGELNHPGPPQGYQWFSQNEIKQLATSSLNQKILKGL